MSDKIPAAPQPKPKKQLYLGILFLILAMIATVIVMLMPKEKPKQVADSKYKFIKQGTAIFYSKAGTEKTLFEIEIADTPERQQTGLMYRDSMAVNQAMLFTFDNAQEQNFWMKNTYLPLDIIYIGPDSTIVSIAQNTVPYSEETIPSKGLTQYVLEINAGLSQKLGIIPGDKLSWKRD
jgi:uncharacterized membrane protein (UPF0127 family)